MLLQEPPQTEFDLKFSLGDIPIRVHPAFLILPVIWGASWGSQASSPGIAILIFILVFFVSILIHELGHAIVMKFFGEAPHIVLYWMGGLAISGGAPGNPWKLSYRSRGRNELEQIIISFAGPAAGFLLALLTLLIFKWLGATVAFRFNWLPQFDFLPAGGTVLDQNQNLYLLLHVSFFINLYLNLLNLAPVFPLDGGQIARSIYLRFDPWNGIKYSLWLSLIVAAAIALLFGIQGARFALIFFGLLALQNFQELQMMRTGGFGGGRPW